MDAAKAMLDDIHPNLIPHERDTNIYTLGNVGSRNIVIACPPKEEEDKRTASAAAVAARREYSFQWIEFGLAVGIGGGVPSADIRLGDIVVSTPKKTFGGVVYFGKTVVGDSFVLGRNKPPALLLAAVSGLESAHTLGGSQIMVYLAEILRKHPNFAYPGQQQDRFFQAKYDHVGSGNTCDGCDKSKLLNRPPRWTDVPEIHHGLIASIDEPIEHGTTRDKDAHKSGILCFETEGASGLNSFPCLVIRGISDYADSHKNKEWQGYAAAIATAYAKEILLVISQQNIGG